MSIIGQAFELMGELGKRVPWGEFKKNELQNLVNDIARVGPEFVQFLKNGGRVEVVVAQFPTWRTVTLGLHQSAEAYASSIEAKGKKISTWARQWLAKILFAKEPTTIELVRVRGSDLGQTDVETRAQIYARALARGLDKVPAEVGSALRDQYDDQPMGEYLLVASDPFEDSGGSLDVFHVCRDDGGTWLDTDDGHPGDRWGPGGVWVFARRKQ